MEGIIRKKTGINDIKNSLGTEFLKLQHLKIICKIF